MSRFTDILNATLPSQQEEVKESSDATLEDVMNIITEAEDVNDDEEEPKDTDVEDQEDTGSEDDDANDAADGEDDEDGEFDIDDLTDDELEAMDKQLSSDVADAVAADDEGEDEEVKLSPEEEMEADDMMAVAATTMLVKDEMNAQERAEFLKDEAQVKCAVNEGFLTDADVNELMTEAELVEEKYNNKMIIKLNAEAKKRQLYALAVNVSAAAHHDPDWVKYKKCIKLKKLIHKKLERKYAGEAKKRARVYFARLQKSGAPALAKIAK